MEKTVELLQNTISGIDQSINNQKQAIKFAQDQIDKMNLDREQYVKELEIVKTVVASQ